MSKKFFMALRYLISSEESRLGRQDYWNSVYLVAKKPLNRACLELGKVLFVLTLSISILLVLNRL